MNLALTRPLANANLSFMSAKHCFYIREGDPPAKQEIMRAAMKLFGEHGLAATSIRHIAVESGYTNPALYKHFAGKEDLALQLFETSHRRVWSLCNSAIESADGFEKKLEGFIGAWLRLMDDYPEVVAFLSDSARVLWPKANEVVRQHTMIGLARSLVQEAQAVRSGTAKVNPDIAAASLQGTMSEIARMLQVGVLDRPAMRLQDDLVAYFRDLIR